MISRVSLALVSFAQVPQSRISLASCAPAVVDGQLCLATATTEPFVPRWCSGLVLVTSRKPVFCERFPEPWQPGQVVVNPNVLPIRPSPPQTPQFSEATEHAHSLSAAIFFDHAVTLAHLPAFGRECKGSAHRLLLGAICRHDQRAHPVFERARAETRFERARGSSRGRYQAVGVARLNLVAQRGALTQPDGHVFRGGRS
jgi:hypothetical protein